MARYSVQAPSLRGKSRYRPIGRRFPPHKSGVQPRLSAVGSDGNSLGLAWALELSGAAQMGCWCRLDA